LDAVALWALQGPGPLDVRNGVVYAPGNPMQVLGTSATSPWAVTVNPGHIVADKSGTSNGVYYSANDALTTVALAVPPASNSRIDTIYGMQMDSAAIVNPDGSTAAVIGAVTGTTGNGGLGATPTAPAVPVGALALYSVQILSTATAGTSGAGVTITRLFGWTVPRGVPIPVLSQAERDAQFPTPYNGLKVDRLDGGFGVQYFDSVIWRWVTPPAVTNQATRDNTAYITLYDGLIVYRSDLHCFQRYDGTIWHSGAIPLVYTDAGLATSGGVNVYTTALRTITDPFGAGVPYRCRTTYRLGIVTGTTGGTARAWINSNGVGVLWAQISTYSSAAPSVITDMPAGGTVTFQGVLTNLSVTLTTNLDAGSHYMTTEVTPL
jgi:hypothetical protein